MLFIEQIGAKGTVQGYFDNGQGFTIFTSDDDDSWDIRIRVTCNFSFEICHAKLGKPCEPYPITTATITHLTNQDLYKKFGKELTEHAVRELVESAIREIGEHFDVIILNQDYGNLRAGRYKFIKGSKQDGISFPNMLMPSMESILD